MPVLRGAILAVFALGLLMASASTASQPTSGSNVSLPRSRASLDYTAEATEPIAPVSAAFIADQLGPAFLPSAAGAAAAIAVESSPSAAAVAAGTKQFRCVGGRQTSDPLAPPCDDMPFDGDNGGATWTGVEKDEVRVLIRLAGGQQNVPPQPFSSPAASGASPAMRYIDLGQPARPQEPVVAGAFRDLQTYFNLRYQTFGRALRFILFFDDDFVRPSEEEAKLAVENLLLTRPFAVVNLLRDHPFMASYLDTAAARGVPAFDGVQVRSSAFFRRRPDLLWGYHASVEVQAEQYASYVCQKVVPHPVVLTDDPLRRGRQRRLALLHTDNPSHEGYRRLGRRVGEGVRACGGPIAAVATYRTQEEQCTNLPNELQEEDLRSAEEDLRLFRESGVTTILWPGCPTSSYPMVASALGYYPEWVVLGDPYMTQAALAGTYAGAGAVWDRKAIMVSARPFQPPVWRTRCWSALEEVDPDDDESYARGAVCEGFGAIQQVVASIQLGGARLTPASMAVGLRRLEVTQSADPQVPTCSYGPVDSTCIQDAHALLFDMAGTASEFEPLPNIDHRLPYQPSPCWRAIEAGRRYLPGHWPAGNVDAQLVGGEPCTYDQQQVPRDGVFVGRF